MDDTPLSCRKTRQRYFGPWFSLSKNRILRNVWSSLACSILQTLLRWTITLHMYEFNPSKMDLRAKIRRRQFSKMGKRVSLRKLPWCLLAVHLHLRLSWRTLCSKLPAEQEAGHEFQGGKRTLCVVVPKLGVTWLRVNNSEKDVSPHTPRWVDNSIRNDIFWADCSASSLQLLLTVGRRLGSRESNLCSGHRR